MLEKQYKITKTKDDLLAQISALIGAIENPVWGKIANQADQEYLSWDEFRKKDWATDAALEIWAVIKHNRKVTSEPKSILDQDGNFYRLSPQRHLEFLHEVDMELGGNLLGIKSFEDGDKRQFIRRNLIEESIASSQLEGSNTSRETARRMLSEGRKPKDKSERMIVNNHAAMTWIEETGKNQKLSIELLLDLHRMVTQGTMSDETKEGRLRDTLDAKGNRLVIKPFDDVTIAYVTPDREFVDQQLPNLFAFANDEDGSPFIHPLIKGILLHFWIGLLHPFEDGNGRLARILFYWYMLKKGYWAFSYLSLSERILKSPKQYAMAYINSEQDNYDLNYFVQYNIEKLKTARAQLNNYLNSRIADNQERTKLLESGEGLNLRQIRLLQHLNFGEASHTNLNEYQNTYTEIGKLTAINDLKSLVARGYLRKQKNGRNTFYLPTEKLGTLFK